MDSMLARPVQFAAPTLPPAREIAPSTSAVPRPIPLCGSQTDTSPEYDGLRNRGLLYALQMTNVLATWVPSLSPCCFAKL
jgi:hypothetical protein